MYKFPFFITVNHYKQKI